MLPLIQARREAHLPRILATKETATVEAAVDKEDVIRSRCEKAAQVGIDVHTHKARKLLCNLDISLEDVILRLSPELKVLVRNKRSTANYGRVDVDVEADGDTECSGDGGQENDDETEHPKDDDGISTDSEDEDCDEVHKSDESEQVCATTMLAFAVPQQPSTDPMEIITQRMEEMQRSFTQQLQDLAGQLHPQKSKKKTNKQSRQAMGVSNNHIDGTSLANPPPPPLDPVGDFSSSRKVQRTTRRVTKVKFNGSIKNYKEGRSGNANLVESS